MLKLYKACRQACLFVITFLSLGLSQAAFADRLKESATLTQRAADGLLLDIYSTGERLVVVGDHGVILASDDQGLNWKQIESPVSVMLTAVNFASEQSGWAVGHDGAVLRTQDGGTSWNLIMTGDDINQLVVDQVTKIVDAGGDPLAPDMLLEDLEYFLDDAMAAQEEGPSLPLLNVLFTDEKTGFLLGSYGLLMRTQDAGTSWEVLSHRVPNIDRFHLNQLFHTGRDLFIAGEAGMLFRSSDMGETWELLESPYDGSFFAITEYQNRLLALGLRGHLFESTDRGDSWQQVDLGTGLTLTDAVVDQNKILFTGLGGLVLQGNNLSDLSTFEEGDRRSWSAGARVSGGWVLVGEKGIKRITDADLEKSNG